MHRRRRLAGLLAITFAFGGAAAACADDAESGDTLAPLPAPDPTTTTTPLPASTVPATAATTTTTLAPQPIGDWDGARFDIGSIEGAGEDGLYRTIRLDRYSYNDPDIGLVDAAGFSEEPSPRWWRDDPFENNRPDVREFVLSPNAELLRLAEEDEEVACADPAPARLPEERWEGVDISFLGTRAARREIAILTYAPSGPVTRIRFTRGCD